MDNVTESALRVRASAVPHDKAGCENWLTLADCVSRVVGGDNGGLTLGALLKVSAVPSYKQSDDKEKWKLLSTGSSYLVSMNTAFGQEEDLLVPLLKKYTTHGCLSAFFNSAEMG